MSTAIPGRSAATSGPTTWAPWHWSSKLAIRLKGKRKVKVNGRTYVWYVADETARDVPDEGFVAHELPLRYLHIISTDRAFVVHYRLPLAGEPHSRLEVEGRPLPRAPKKTILRVPRWRHDTKRYPTADFVRRLIGWCLSEDD